jgi:hypothetical protein
MRHAGLAECRSALFQADRWGRGCEPGRTAPAASGGLFRGQPSDVAQRNFTLARENDKVFDIVQRMARHDASMAVVTKIGGRYRPSAATIFAAALRSDEQQVQAEVRTHLIHRPARDIVSPLGGARVSSYRI